MNIVCSVKLLKQISLLYWFIICTIINLCCRAVQLKDLWFICILKYLSYWNNPIKILIRYKVLLTFTSLYMYKKIYGIVLYAYKIRARKSHQVLIEFVWLIYRLAAKILSSNGWLASVCEQSNFLYFNINHN